MQPFPPWEPDAYQVNAGIASEVTGVLPGSNSYRPLPQTATSSVAASTVIRGAYAARTVGDALKIYALSATKAYHFAGVSSAWDDYTRLAGGDYTLATDDYWVCRQFGTTLVAVDGTGADAPQSIDVDSGTNFAALGGSPPKARCCEVIGDFMFLGGTATDIKAIKNSARNDASGWTAGQKDSDGQIFPDGGAVQALAGYEIGGLVFQSETVRRISLRQDAAIYETHRIDAARGTSSPYSVVKDGADVYYYSTTGFMKIGGDGSVMNIGIGRVNDWFSSNRNTGRPKALIGALDPLVRRIFWLFATASNGSSTTLDGLIVYDIERDRWTHATTALTFLFTAAVPGLTLANLAAIYTTLSAVPYPFGSDVWKGGAPGLAAFDSANKLCFFTGTPMAASVQTSPFEPIPGKRCFVQGFRLYGDATTITGKVGGAARAQDAIVFNPAQSVNAQGRIPALISTRVAQVQVDIPAGTTWTHLAGIDFDGDDLSDDGEA